MKRKRLQHNAFNIRRSPFLRPRIVIFMLAAGLCFAGCKKQELINSTESSVATPANSSLRTLTLSSSDQIKLLSFNVRGGAYTTDPETITQREGKIRQI